MNSNVKLKSVSRHCRLSARFIKPENNKAMLSISRPNDPAPLQPGWKHLLRLEFHDIETEHNELVIFNTQMAEAIISWIHQIDSCIEHLHIHCFAGISRSSALKKFIIEYYRLSATDPCFFYNKHVYRTLKKVNHSNLDVLANNQ